MSKILAISDIHIHDYPNRNPNDRFRLDQSSTVADNIIAVAQQEGIDTIVIAGDTLEKSMTRAYILGNARNFLWKIMSYFREGFIIWGNHDLDTKGSNQSDEDCYLSLFLPPNLHYADHKTIKIDNTSIAFSNWYPEFDLSWIQEPVDVLFTHATIDYSGGNSMFKSQVLDESKFSLAICGDIHKPARIGKYVSIGIPQKCKMSDSDDLTGFVYDCVTHQCDWVNLNPFDNLMKFRYTTDSSLEGWDPGTRTWSIYQPSAIDTNTPGNSGGSINIPSWTLIEQLINSLIINYELTGVHDQVLKNLGDDCSREVDFNFTLTRLYCKNWRSIGESEIFFNEGDKILITGQNGSGKSSLLSALRFAFKKPNNIADFLRYGEKEVITEVDFIYQGINYKIRKGKKGSKLDYGLWIDGNLKKYNNSSQFDNDLLVRFPFIEYMDTFFFDSNHHRFIGDLTPERKSEIISKFYKLDKIDAYNEEAIKLLTDLNTKETPLKEKITNLTGRLQVASEELSKIEVPGWDKKSLIESRDRALTWQKKYNELNNYNLAVSTINGQIQSESERLIGMNNKLSELREYQEINTDIESTRSQKQALTEERESFNVIIFEYNQLNSELTKLGNEGTRLSNERSGLDKTRVCSVCGQVITNTESLEKHKLELDQKLLDLGNQYKAKKLELDQVIEKLNNTDQQRKALTEQIEILDRKVLELIREKTELEQCQSEIQKITNTLENLQTRLSSYSQPEKVDPLPENFYELLSGVNEKINAWDRIEKLNLDIYNYQEEIKSIQEGLNILSGMRSDVERYITLTNSDGEIYKQIFEKLASQFTDNLVKYEVTSDNRKGKRNRAGFNFDCSYNNNGNWVSYDNCSSGQQTVLDVNFLNKIVNRLGLLVMDEFLKHLDPRNHDICIDMISAMNVGCILLSSHMESIASFNNRSCTLEMEHGVTKINLV